jgi:hypothetical protein
VDDDEESIQNRTRARRDSQPDGTNTLSRNAGFNQYIDGSYSDCSRVRPSLGVPGDMCQNM